MSSEQIKTNTVASMKVSKTCFVCHRTHVERDAWHVVSRRHMAASGGDVRRPNRGGTSETVRAPTSRRQSGADRQGPTNR